MENLAQRLNRALVQRGLKVKPFAKQIEDRGIPRSSYSMVRRYLEPIGDYQPQQDWLVEAAKLLRVRLPWLVAGHGPMELGAAGIESRPIYEVAGCSNDAEVDVFMARLNERFPRVGIGLTDHKGIGVVEEDEPGYEVMTETVQLVFNNMFGRWLGSMDLNSMSIEERADKAVQLGELLMAPLRVLRPERLHTRRYTDFMLSQLIALGLAMPGWPE